MTGIALLVPTRGRAEQFKRMVQSAYRTSTTAPYVFMHAGFDGDQEMPAKQYEIGDLIDSLGGRFRYASGPNYPTCYTWNMLAQEALKTDAKLFMLAADDMIFSTPSWDKALLDHYNALENKVHVYALQDSRDVDGTPHPIVTREWIDALGYFMPPIFLHWHIDSWTVAMAKANGVFTHLKDYLLIHDKPSDTGQGDETHNRIRASGWRERDAYVNETCQHFLMHETKRLDDYLRSKEEPKGWRT